MALFYCDVHQSGDISKYFSGMTIDIDASRQRRSLDFLRGLRIKNAVEKFYASFFVGRFAGSFLCWSRFVRHGLW
jgi:hypothetical protein